MPDVRLPDGTVVKNVPDGITQAELIRRVSAGRAQKPREVTIGPTDAAISSVDEVRNEFERGNAEIPFAKRMMNWSVSPEQGRAALPIATGTAASLFSGGIIPSALLFGGGAGVGELLTNMVGGDKSVSDAVDTGTSGARDALIGGAAFKALVPVGRYVFGRGATESGEQAMEFARRRALEMDDEAAAIARRTPGLARPSPGQNASDTGYPRLAIDSITDGSLLDGARFLLTGAATSNARAKQAAVFINNELSNFVGQVPKATGIVNDARQLVFSDPGLKALKQFDRISDPDKWIDSVVSGSNASALLQLARSSPELHRQLLAKNLENVLSTFTRPAPNLGPRVVDGLGLRKWYESNMTDLVKVYGFGVAKKLDDFTNYAQYLDGPVAAAEAGVGGSLGTLGIVGRTAAEGGGLGVLPHVVLPMQASAWVLGNTLMNPASATFKFFSALPHAGRTIQAATQAEAANLEVGRGLPNPQDIFVQ